MFKNVKTADEAEIHSIPMDVQAGVWIDSDKHMLSKDCPCAPEAVKSSFTDFHGEVFHHYRRGRMYEQI